MSEFLLPDVLVNRARQVVEANRAAGKRIAVAESCTGGLVSAALTEIPGSSTCSKPATSLTRTRPRSPTFT